MTCRRLVLYALMLSAFIAGAAWGLTEEFAACRYESAL
jgi:hypothetical protein